MKKKFTFNLWDLLSADEVNDILDNELKNGFASDIDYECLKISKGGDITVKAEFDLEKTEG